MARKIYGIIAILCLVFGFVIYLLFRNINIFIFNLIPIPKIINNINFNYYKSVNNSFFIYNMPDILWFLSGVLLIRCICFFEYKTQTIYLICFYLIALAMECSQLLRAVSGTFDILDLLSIFLVAIIESLFFNIILKRRLEKIKWNIF